MINQVFLEFHFQVLNGYNMNILYDFVLLDHLLQNGFNAQFALPQYIFITWNYGISNKFIGLRKTDSRINSLTGQPGQRNMI